jgi:hypothetical protein
MEGELATKPFVNECDQGYLNAIRTFIAGQVNRLAKFSQSHGLSDALETQADSFGEVKLLSGAHGVFLRDI